MESPLANSANPGLIWSVSVLFAWVFCQKFSFQIFRTTTVCILYIKLTLKYCKWCETTTIWGQENMYVSWTTLKCILGNNWHKSPKYLIHLFTAIQYYIHLCLMLLYLGSTVKPVLSGHSKRRSKIGFQDGLSLNAGQKYCRMLQESIPQYFWPSLSHTLSLRPLFCLFLSGRLRQVLLYIHCLLTFFKINFFQKLFQEYYQSVKWSGSRSALIFCQPWYRSKLFVKVIRTLSSKAWK